MSSVMNAPNPPNVTLHHIQQRQILAMMGIEVWVAQKANIIDIDDVYPNVQINEQIQLNNQADTQGLVDLDTINTELDTVNQAAVDHIELIPEAHDYSQNIAIETSQTLNAPSNDQSATTTEPTAVMSDVPAFTMIGASFQNWVIMVTSDDLKQTAHAQLWQNICTALSLQAEQLSFPICEGINDLDSANATLAGFVFRVSQKDAVNLAVLGQLPKGVAYRHRHAQSSAMPSLAQMLADPQQKRRFWQILTTT